MGKLKLKTLILAQLKQFGQIQTIQIAKKLCFSRAYVNRAIKELVEEGQIVLMGKSNRARYVLAVAENIEKAKQGLLSFRSKIANKNLSEDILLEKIKRETGLFLGLPKNIAEILEYSFTEILNNAIEHSQSEMIEVRLVRNNIFFRFDIIDFGIGIFKNIMATRRLASEHEAIEDLLKGKQTTAPDRHSGEGLFFTSKVADSMTIASSTKNLLFNNFVSDLFIHDIRSRQGTKVSFILRLDSKRKLADVFNQYADKQTFEFKRTRVLIRLYKLSDKYISRSQARRLLSGLQDFKTIVLDYKDVQSVGQGFADEIYRVWPRSHPGIQILTENASENVQFMIDRARK